VTLFQVRLTARDAPAPAAPKLVLAMLVMGLPFLVLVWTHSSRRSCSCRRVRRRRDALGADLAGGRRRLAPADIRGAYMGASGAPRRSGSRSRRLIGLQDAEQLRRRGDVGDVRRIGVVAAVLGGLALAGLDRRPGASRSAVLEA
jgi:hypothetical protein